MPRRHRTNPRPAEHRDDFDDFDEAAEATAPRKGRDPIQQLLVDLIGRWYWIALGVALGLLAGAYHHSKSPERYSATATVLMKQRAPTVMSRDRADEMDMGSAEGMNTVAARLIRMELLEKVASRPDIRALPGLMPQRIEWLPEWSLAWFGREPVSTDEVRPVPAASNLAGAISGWVDVSIRRGTRLLDVTVRHPVPEVAQAVANAVCVEFVKERTSERTLGRSGSLQILMDESEAARTRLQQAQNAIAIYQSALNTLQELEERETAVTQLSRRYLAKHPRMITAQAELETAQKRFLAEFESVRNSAADRSYWEEHEAERREDEADETARLQIARRLLTARGNVLQSEIASQTGVFNSILTRIQESDINQQSTESELEMSSLARLPGSPFEPIIQKSLTMGGAGGAVFGLLIAFAAVRRDNTFHTVSEIENSTGMPTLAAIPRLDSAALKLFAKKAMEAKEANPEGSDARARWDKTMLFHPGASASIYAESFRVLRASVSLLGDEKKRRINLVSSALPGEGKSFVAANYALAAAQQGRKTLLIDADLRKPSIHMLFGVARDVTGGGTTEVLAHQKSLSESVLTNTGVRDLHILLSGSIAPSPGELLESATLENLLDEALQSYDLIVIDSAPLLAVPDTRVLTPQAHNFILVVRAEHTPKGAVLRTLEMLEADGYPPDGIIVNSFTEKRSLVGKNYSYGYYRTSRYGRPYRYGYGTSYGSYGSYGAS